MTKIASLETVFHWENGLIEKKVSKASLTIDGTKKTYNKNGILAGNLGDLEKLGKKLQILNLHNNKVVRTITFSGDSVIIDVMDGNKPLSFPKSREVFYEEWTMDRGSYLFWNEMLDCYGKLATENDPVVVLE